MDTIEAIENFKYKDFIKQDPELVMTYTNYLTVMEGLPIKNEIEDLTLNQVEEIRQGLFIDSEMPIIFNYVEDISEDEFMNMRILELFGKLTTIKEQIEKIIDLEEKYLVPEHSNVKWEMVEGPSKIKRFGIIPMVDSLADGDVLKWEAILNTQYSTIFRKLMYDTAMGDLNHKMTKIKTKSDV